MKRALLSVPEGLTFGALTAAQQAAIQSVFGQFVMPMPGTAPFNGAVVVDAVTTDSYNPANHAAYDLPFTLLGLWQWSGEGVVELMPLDPVFTNYLPPTHEYDEAGNTIATHPPVLHVPHNFSGWPEVLL